MDFHHRSTYDNPSTSYLNEEIFDKPDLDEETDYAYPPRRQPDFYQNKLKPLYGDAKDQDDDVEFSASQQALRPAPVEKDSRSCFQRYLPSSLACRLYLLAVLIQTAIDVALEADILIQFHDVPSKADATNDSDNLQRLPVYLGIFALAQLFNGALLLYAGIQISEIRSIFPPNQTGVFSKVPITILTDIIPIVIGVAEIVYIGLGWKIYTEFGWKVYKLLGADRQIKKMYAQYQVFECMLKFDVFFWLGFSVQFIGLVLKRNDFEFGLTIAALPLSMLLLIQGHLAAKYESRWMMWSFLAGLVAGFAYFSYKRMTLLKRSATDAQFPPSIAHQNKRPMYAQSLPNREIIHDFHNEDLPEGHSLLNRWMLLIGDTVRAVKESLTNHHLPVNPGEYLPEAAIPLPSTPDPEPEPTTSSRPQLSIPSLDFELVDKSCTLDGNAHIPPPPSLTSSNSTQTADSVSTNSSTIGAHGQPPRMQYPKHNHVHLTQSVQDHNEKELERLKNRRLQYNEEWDMERTLLNAQKIVAEEAGDKFFKEWQTQTHLGKYRSDFDTFAIRPKKPRPLIPSFERLRATVRQRDKEINKRIRQATRLPTHLPQQIIEEVHLFRSKYDFSVQVAKEQVTHADLSRLDPRGPSLWLNDEIINFYGALLMQRAERYIVKKKDCATVRKGKEPEYLNIHYFNTFFWPKIEKGYKENRLNKWTKKFDIFSKDIILIPVNHRNIHWSLAAINLKKKRIESYDSVGEYHTKIYQKLRYYLQEEHTDKKKKPFDFTGWEDYYDEKMWYSHVFKETPQQENGYDCGVFTCQFMESLSRGVDNFPFDQSNMPYIRDRMTWEIGRSKLWGETDS
ncbi:hypothetical protein Clacol_003809 [Clathrus columnatus]|uniref:Ubiquitin-like protease family profile domain-containing protein n=1 Tax=Clathrus columnatus TaxID=1419009 RepID=A0AAV5A4L2_9AGAM|nr:hypothetical protein Clacol_003809 [Clathrus columnatus]